MFLIRYMMNIMPSRDVCLCVGSTRAHEQYIEIVTSLVPSAKSEKLILLKLLHVKYNYNTSVWMLMGGVQTAATSSLYYRE